MAGLACSVLFNGVAMPDEENSGSSKQIQGRVNPEIPIRQEFDAAIEKNDQASLELFIKRHPYHPLAEKARQYMATHGMEPVE